MLLEAAVHAVINVVKWIIRNEYQTPGLIFINSVPFLALCNWPLIVHNWLSFMKRIAPSFLLCTFSIVGNNFSYYHIVFIVVKKK